MESTWISKINRELVISTAHLPEHLALDLSDNDCEYAFPYDAVEQGYLVYTRSFTNEPERYPPQMHAALRLALQHNCKWLRYDSDGSVVDGLPVWDW